MRFKRKKEAKKTESTLKFTFQIVSKNFQYLHDKKPHHHILINRNDVEVYIVTIRTQNRIKITAHN